MMKNIFGKIITFIFPFAVILLLAESCRKEEVPVSPYADTDIPILTGYLEEITDTVYFDTAEDFFNYLVDSSAVWREAMEVVYLKNIAELGLRNYLDVGVNPDGTSKLHFLWYNFTYRTVDTQNNPVLLTGAVAFPNNSDLERRYELTDITLYSSHYILPHDQSPTEAGSPAMLRVMFNNMVVMPELQGNGGSYGRVESADIIADAAARQAIDCELAAIELIGKLGLKMQHDYGTYNMGASKGAFTAMAVHKLLETSETPDIGKVINLKSSYCGCGPYDLSEALEFYCWQGGEMKYPWFIPIAAKNIFDTYRKSFAEYELADFFTDRFNDAGIIDKGKSYTLLEAVISQEFSVDELNSIFSSLGFSNLMDILNERMFDYIGMPDKDDELFSLFDKYLQINNPACGWKPGVPIMLTGAPDDDFVPYETTRDTYEKLLVGDKGVPNRNVIWKDMPEEIGHIDAAVYCILDMIVYKDPAIQLNPF